MNFKNITLGQYYPVNSWVHNLDARSKLIATIVIIGVLFFASSAMAYGVIAIFVALAIVVSRVPFAFVLRGVRALVYIILFTFMLNILFAPGEVVLLSLGFLTITEEGLLWGLQMTTRLIMLLIVSSMLTLTTSPVSLTSAIESLLGPFKKVGLPVHEIAMMMTIALRFIPTLIEETDKIMKAQMARGASFDTGSIMQRAKSLIPIIIPLFVSAFRRADDLAMAMEARCYRGDGNRTKMKELRYGKRDMLAFGCLVGLIVAVVSISRL